MKSRVKKKYLLLLLCYLLYLADVYRWKSRHSLVIPSSCSLSLELSHRIHLPFPLPFSHLYLYVNLCLYPYQPHSKTNHLESVVIPRSTKVYGVFGNLDRQFPPSRYGEQIGRDAAKQIERHRIRHGDTVDIKHRLTHSLRM